jgi:PAP2 superfamily
MGFFALVASPAVLIFNHLVMSWRMPLADGLLIAADRAVGFQWLAYAVFVSQHPWLTASMQLAYDGVHVAVGACVALHALSGRSQHVSELAGLLLVTGVIGSMIGVFFPALAAMTMLGTAELANQLPPLAGRIFVEPLLAMQSADMLVLDRFNLTGITALPSYHTTLGVLSIYSCRTAWWSLAPMTAYAILMIAATPIFGGHYLADIVSAIMLSTFMIWAWRNHLEQWFIPDGAAQHARA